MPIINRKGFKGNIKRKKGRMRKGKKQEMKKGQQRIGKPSPQIFDQVYATVTSINRQATFW